MTRRRVVHALVLAGGFIVYASANAVVPLARELRALVGFGGADAALFLLPFAAGFAVGVPLWFAVGRRWTPVRIMGLSLIGVAAATLVFIAAASPGLVVAARAVLGVAAAGYPPAAQAFVTDNAEPHRRGRALAAFVAAVVAGSFGGQALAGVLGDMVGARTAISLIGAAAPLCVATVLWPALGHPPSASDEEAEEGHRLAIVHGLAPVLVVAALAFGGYWLMLSDLSATLRFERFHLSVSEAGVVPLLGLAGILGATATGHLLDRLGHRRPMVLVLVLGTLGLLATVAADSRITWFTASYGLFLTAYWSCLPPLSAEVAARTANGGQRQAGLMLLYAAMWTGAAVTPLLISLLHSWNRVALLTAAAWALAAAVALRTFSSQPEPRRPGG